MRGIKPGLRARATGIEKTLLQVFRSAYRDLDLFPLLRPEDIQAFRVEYGGDTLVQLEQAVDDSPEEGKIIFSGHRGCGKSTLLADFSKRMQQQGYFVVFFSISDMVEMSAVDHVNILYSIAVQLLSKASERQVTIPHKTKEEILTWLSTTQTSAEVRDLKAQVGVGGDLLKIITAKLQAESTFREEIKRTYERRITDLVKKIEEIARLIREATQKQVLVVIDDLDKLDWKLVEEIYKNNINALFQPKLKIVFTIPIAVIRDIELRTILRSESGESIQQMEVAKFFSKADRHLRQFPNLQKIEVFLEVLRRRFGEDWERAIAPDTAQKIVLLSGGVLRELVRIARECCRQCSLQLRQQPQLTDMKINDDILERAIREIRNEFSLSLGKRRYEILATLYREAKPAEAIDDEFALLLHGLYVLEYRNDEVWYDVHPIVQELLRRENLIPPDPDPDPDPHPDPNPDSGEAANAHA